MNTGNLELGGAGVVRAVEERGSLSPCATLDAWADGFGQAPAAATASDRAFPEPPSIPSWNREIWKREGRTKMSRKWQTAAWSVSR